MSASATLPEEPKHNVIDAVPRHFHHRQRTDTVLSIRIQLKQIQTMSNPVQLPRSKSPKHRIDKLLVDQGHAASRERARALILAGRVLVDEQRVDKPGTAIAAEAVIRLL